MKIQTKNKQTDAILGNRASQLCACVESCGKVLETKRKRRKIMLVITSYAKSYASKSIKAYSIRELLCTLLGTVHKKQVIRLLLL